MRGYRLLVLYWCSHRRRLQVCLPSVSSYVRLSVCLSAEVSIPRSGIFQPFRSRASGLFNLGKLWSNHQIGPRFGLGKSLKIIKKNIQASLMKLCMWTGSNVLIMDIIFFSPSHENSGSYGNRNSQNVAKTNGSDDNSKAIQPSLMKLGMWTGGNLIVHRFKLV